MKKVITILILSLVLFQALAQPLWENKEEGQGESNSFSENLALFIPEVLDQTHIVSDVEELLSKAYSKYHQDTIFWLEKLFYYVQRKELKGYENYVSLSQTLTTQEYDCVTGSALFAIILSQLEVPYQIIEFPYHVTLTLWIDDTRIMMESTDPHYGFVKNEAEYKERLEFYLYNQDFQEPYMEVIGLEELAGLHFYNLAYADFMERKLESAYQFIQKAEGLYPCDRIQSLKYQIHSEMTELAVLN